MRILLAMVLGLVLVGCGSTKDDVAAVPEREAATAGEQTEQVDLSTPEKAVYEALRVARMQDREEAFAAYLRLMHPDVVADKYAVEAVRHNVFKRFRQQHDWYVHGDSDADFVRVKRIPAVVTDEVTQVEIHVRDLLHKDNPPAVIVLRRHGKEWRIVQNGM